MQEDVPTFWLESSGERGVHTKQPVTNADLEQLQWYAVTGFGRGFPQDYVSFLRQSDGLQVENACFMAASEVALLNGDSTIDGRIRIGDAGNIDDFFFDVRTSKFVIAPIGRHDEISSSHDTFWELLRCVLKQQGVLRNA